MIMIKFLSEIGLKVLYNLFYRPFPINVLFTCFYIKNMQFFTKLKNFCVQTTNLIRAKFTPNLYFGLTYMH